MHKKAMLLQHAYINFKEKWGNSELFFSKCLSATFTSFFFFWPSKLSVCSNETKLLWDTERSEMKEHEVDKGSCLMNLY